MSALSIPPSQKPNVSTGLQSIHNYANILNPVTFIGGDQYSVVAVYTEVEVGESEADEEITEEAEVQIQTDFYEEEIGAVGADNTASVKSTNFKTDEISETVDVAKALETLTKTFALRKENVGQDALTEMTKTIVSNVESSQSDEQGQGSATDDGNMTKTLESGYQIVEQRGNTDGKMRDEVIFQSSSTESNMNTEMIDGSSQVPVSEEEQPDPFTNVRKSTRLQMKTPPTWPGMCKFKKSSREMSSEPKMYEDLSYICTFFFYLCICLSLSLKIMR